MTSLLIRLSRRSNRFSPAAAAVVLAFGAFSACSGEEGSAPSSEAFDTPSRVSTSLTVVATSAADRVPTRIEIARSGPATALVPFTTLSGDTRRSTPNRVALFTVGAAGDSYGSGDGAPVTAANQSLDRPGNLGTMWGSQTGFNGCHRSDNAGIVKAFNRLKTEFPVFPMELRTAACSGARISNLIDELKGDDVTERTDRWEAIAEPPQMDQLNSMFRGLDTPNQVTPIDVLALSIGGNDAGFAPAVSACVVGGLPESLGLPAGTVIGDLRPSCDADAHLASSLANGSPHPPASDPPPPFPNLPGWAQVRTRYRGLSGFLAQFSRSRPIGQVLITHYAAGLKNDGGDAYCGGLTGATATDIFGLVSPHETAWLETHLIGALNTAVDQAVDDANAQQEGPRWHAVSSHVARFLNHGPCSSDPWTNTNSAAINGQGNDLPDPPDDPTRPKLYALSVGLSTLSGTALGCGLTPLLCGTGATGGLIVGLATANGASAISSGMAHPNAKGYAAVADALLPELERSFRETFLPTGPDRLRQYGAAEQSNIVMRWDDLARTETRYELEVHSLDSGPTPTTPLLTVTLPADSSEYNHHPSGSFVGRYRVRACNSAFCSDWSPLVKATNIKASKPVDLQPKERDNNPPVTGYFPRYTLTVEASDPHKADTSMHVELTLIEDGHGLVAHPIPAVITMTTPLPATFAIDGEHGFGLPFGRYRVRVASCNLLGCSDFTSAVDCPYPDPPAPRFTLPQELLPAAVDELGHIIPGGDVGPPPPFPG